MLHGGRGGLEVLGQSSCCSYTTHLGQSFSLFFLTGVSTERNGTSKYHLTLGYGPRRAHERMCRGYIVPEPRLKKGAQEPKEESQKFPGNLRKCFHLLGKDRLVFTFGVSLYIIISRNYDSMEKGKGKKIVPQKGPKRNVVAYSNKIPLRGPG